MHFGCLVGMGVVFRENGLILVCESKAVLHITAEEWYETSIALEGKEDTAEVARLGA